MLEVKADALEERFDAPLGETAERYCIRLAGSAGSVVMEADKPIATFSSAQLGSAGSCPAIIQVAQVGERAISRWTPISINLP